MWKTRSLPIMMLAGLLLAGCSFTGGASSEPVTPQPAAENEAAQTAVPTSMPVEETEASTETESEAQAQSTPTEEAQSQAAALPDQGPIPTGSSALKATDPSSVNLTDGDPTLVEFFAFW